MLEQSRRRRRSSKSLLLGRKAETPCIIRSFQTLSLSSTICFLARTASQPAKASKGKQRWLFDIGKSISLRVRQKPSSPVLLFFGPLITILLDPSPLYGAGCCCYYYICHHDQRNGQSSGSCFFFVSTIYKIITYFFVLLLQ